MTLYAGAGLLAVVAVFAAVLSGGPKLPQESTAADRPEESTVRSGTEASDGPEECTWEIRAEVTEEEESRVRADMAAFGELDGTDIVSAAEKAGYCILADDGEYPKYLRNAEVLNRFWEAASQGRGASAEVWNVQADGQVSCRVFQCGAGENTCIHAYGERDETGALVPLYTEKKEILFWDMTELGFLYRDIRLDRHWTATELLRLKPVDHCLYALTEAYIAPVGYHNVNLFLLDWDSDDFGDVSFNDLLCALTGMQTGGRIYERDFAYEAEPFPHSVIPADVFEAAVLPYFRITREELRSRAMYDAVADAYPWQDISPENVLYYPGVIPEVTAVTENGDGTVTLRVNVACPDKGTASLFVHEVTVEPGADGSFRYLANRIVSRGEAELPSPQARIGAH